MSIILQFLTENQIAALGEITDVLRAACHAHTLPLALTWMPCTYNHGVGDETSNVRVKGYSTCSDKNYILCIEDSACYVNDKETEGFVHACAEHYLLEGQGIVGKALQSNHPFFYPDVKEYDISVYPLVHHARKFGLGAAVAIRLRSSYTGNDDYILEFFLPRSMKGSTEQQLLLNNLSSTMQRICKSLRTVSDIELLDQGGSTLGFHEGSVVGLPTVSISKSSSQPDLLRANTTSSDQVPLRLSESFAIRTEADGSPGQVSFRYSSL